MLRGRSARSAAALGVGKLVTAASEIQNELVDQPLPDGTPALPWDLRDERRSRPFGHEL